MPPPRLQPRSHSYSHPEPRMAWYAEHLEYARIDLHSTLLAHSPPKSPAPITPKSPKFAIRLRAPLPPYESYNGHDYVEAVPNLELHSAAAEGNVGLVHYALTHGQPINSILHGLQPIHAAAAGGSLSALRMLIDRGADVNAPRLPRRYSSERNKEAPSVGVAGATPLHFAAANGHASVVQLLLTNGAISDKPDQMGQTPEGLAEENGHVGVLDVLRVYDSLRRPGSSRAVSAMSQSDAVSIHTIHSGNASFGGPSRPSSPSNSVHDDQETIPSRKGKERAHSTASDHSGLAKMRKSIGGFLGRRSRKSSLVMSPYHPGQGQVPDRLSIDAPSVMENGHMGEQQNLTVEAERGQDGGHSPFVSSPASSYHSLHDPPQQVTLPNTVILEHEPYSALPSHGSALTRTASTTSADPHNSLLRTPPQIMPPPRERKASHSSRRPSLPSIFEKAVHPGQTFRAVIGKHRNGHDGEEETEGHDLQDAPPIPGHEKPRSASGGSSNGFFVRGRQKSGELGDRGKRYTSGLKGLFRRPHSPPSRSPSPPMRDPTGNYPSQVDPDELNKEIERLRTAKFELERERAMERRHSFDEGDDGSLIKAREAPIHLRPTPKSAPATKTRFFENLDTAPIAEEPGASSTAVRKPNRSRTGSEVIAPSPLANEWPRDSDSDSTSRSRVRRVKTEGAKQGPSAGPSRLSGLGVPPGPRMTKPRSATLPSSPAGYRSPLRTASGSKLVGAGVDWDDAADLRSGVLIRESVKKSEGELSPVLVGQREPNGDEDDTEGEEVYHDASDIALPVHQLSGGEQKRESPPPIQVVRVEDPADGTIELASPPKPTRRFRGASIGSVNSTTSRISTGPGSSVRFSEGSDDGHSERHARYQDALKMHPPASMPVPIQPGVINGPGGSAFVLDTRPRGKSVSSIGTTTTMSGSGYQYSLPLSTPATSITPPSTISITLGGKGLFPPVPEHGTLSDPAPGSPSLGNDADAKLKRTPSSKAEVADMIRQAGDGVLHFAQMPESSESSRDLAAQLAAFGDGMALQEEMARQERRERRERRRMYRELSGRNHVQGDDVSSQHEAGRAVSTGYRPDSRVVRLQEGDSASTSSRSTQRTPSLMSYSGRSESWRSAQSAVSGPRPASSVRDAPTSILVNAEAPRSSLPNINSIYHRRAILHRENMAKLSAAHVIPRPGAAVTTGRQQNRPEDAPGVRLGGMSGGHRPSRYTSSEAQAHVNPPRGAPAWLTGATPTVNREAGSISNRPEDTPGVRLGRMSRTPPASSWSEHFGSTPDYRAGSSMGRPAEQQNKIGATVRSRSRSGSINQYRSSVRTEPDVISSSLPANSLPLVLSSPDSPRSHKSPRKAVTRAGADPSVPVQPLILTRQSVARIDTTGEPSGRIISSPTGARTSSGPLSSQGSVSGRASNGNGTEEVAVIPAQSASYTLPGPSGKGRLLSGGALHAGSSTSTAPGLKSNHQTGTDVTSAGLNQSSTASGGKMETGGAASGPGSRNVSGSSTVQPSTHAGPEPSTRSIAPSSVHSSSAHPLRSAAPAISIFNHRFTGPHDGGDSDDSSEASRVAEAAQKGGRGGRGYMVIENDWRGGKVVDGEVKGLEGEKKGRWGLKGLKGRRS